MNARHFQKKQPWDCCGKWGVRSSDVEDFGQPVGQKYQGMLSSSGREIPNEKLECDRDKTGLHSTTAQTYAK